MSVDKFGRYSENGVKTEYSIKTASFPQTPEGNYDFKGKVIQNVGDPLLPSDAVNVKYMQRKIPSLSNNKWDFSSKKLVNVQPGTEDNHCVVKGQTITSLSDGRFDGKNKQLSNILPGTFESDAATVSQLMKINKNVLKQGKKEHKIITIKTNEKGEKYWDADNIHIRNLPLGRYNNDICIRKQALQYDRETKTFKYQDMSFNFMEYKPDFLIADSSIQSGFRTLDGNEYIPQSYSPKLLVADPSSRSGLRTIDGDEYEPGKVYNPTFRKADQTPLKELTLKTDKHGEKYWNADHIPIRNLPDGMYNDDICLKRQAVLYDEETKVFKYKKMRFDLLEYNKDLLVADSTVSSGIRTLDHEPYLLTDHYPDIIVFDSSTASGLRTLQGIEFVSPLHFVKYNNKLLVADQTAGNSGIKTLDGNPYELQLRNINENLIVADSTSASGLRTLGGKEYKSRYFNPKILIADETEKTGMRSIDGETYQYNKNIILADPESKSGLRTMDGREFIPGKTKNIKDREDPFMEKWLLGKI